MNARTHQHGARRALTVLTGAVLALGIGSVTAPAAQAADPTDLESETTFVTDPVEVGGEGTVYVNVFNRGTVDSGDWTQTITLPDIIAPDPVLEGVDSPQGECTVDGRIVTCTGTGLGAGFTFSAIMTVTGLAPGTDVITAAHVVVPEDPEPANDSHTVPITVVGPETGSGDWGKPGSGLMEPGRTAYYDVAFTCLSAEGCDYGPGMTITDQAMNGGSFNAGTNTVYINGETGIGSCQVTTTDISCTVTGTGHADQGDVIGSTNIGYAVAGGTPPDTQVFAQTIAFPAGWEGNDPSNDVYPIFTPPEAGASIVSAQAGIGAGALALVLGSGLLLRRRQRAGQTPT
ncbi:hypothetical protein [Ruania alba]|uniref:DUF11 domain-containing protein n=1 Tax=Ruania alba TaxID=648782 RepID=A0A1H5CEE1_9MICO|nr:hypothetical protein [Ruania alba]SED64774.1 hypothetical protein SAMN04488554_0342 [Ruania alba]